MNHDNIIEDGTLTPQFLSEEEEALFAEVVLSDEAVTFLNTDLGRLIRGYAIERREEAKEALLAADMDTEEGRNQIKAAQFQAAVANQFLQFIQEALSRGDMAHQQLLQMREQA